MTLEQQDLPEHIKRYIDVKGHSEFSIHISKCKLFDIVGKDTAFLIDLNISKIHSLLYSLASLAGVDDKRCDVLFKAGEEVLKQEMEKYFKLLETIKSALKEAKEEINNG